MNIAATQFTLAHNALEIYVSGCDGKCKGCHNLELRDYNIGTDFRQMLPELRAKVKTFDLLIKSIWVLGGEPLLQKKGELIDLLTELRQMNKTITLFTRFDYEDVPYEIKALCDYIKCGCYIEDLKVEDNVWYGIKLATSNQKIYKVSNL